ncbi:MAG TPA: hypothetical protein VFV50_02750 [Bdellovibrionales bacterium]|nr:hypothetical protein [Bdellovibrionales bacterium]
MKKPQSAGAAPAAAAESETMFLIPSPHLGILTDVMPEKVTQKHNEWIALSRDILQKRRAAEKNGWKQPIDLSEDHVYMHSFGAEFCPALKDVTSLGFILKWPANLILRRTGPRAWQLKGGQDFQFYKFHMMTSFPEAGEAQVISVDLGWMAVTPPGWSVLVKSLPNNLTGQPGRLQFGEAAIRSDQATVAIQAHAFIPPGAPDEIIIKRGEPMVLLMPFKREPIETVILEDRDSITEAVHLLERQQATFRNSTGAYKRLFVDTDNPSPFYEKLLKRWRGRA